MLDYLFEFFSPPVDESCPEDKMSHEVPVSAGAPTAVTSGLMTGRDHTVEIGKLFGIANQVCYIILPASRLKLEVYLLL